MLQGKYSLQPDLHNGHVIYKMHGHPHFIYYSNYYSRWVINQEVNERFTHIVSLMARDYFTVIFFRLILTF